MALSTHNQAALEEVLSLSAPLNSSLWIQIFLYPNGTYDTVFWDSPISSENPSTTQSAVEELYSNIKIMDIPVKNIVNAVNETTNSEITPVWVKVSIPILTLSLLAVTVFMFYCIKKKVRPGITNIIMNTK